MTDTTHLFVYGTLKDPGIVLNYTGRYFEAVKAELKGYEIKTACGYDAIRRNDRAKVPGKVLKNVDEKSLSRLDEYEGGLYRREAVNVQLEGGESVKAYAYVLPEPSKRWKPLLRLVGWYLKVPTSRDEEQVDSWRNKCKASMTPVSIFFAANSALLVFIGEKLVSQGQVCAQRPLQWAVSAVLYGIILWVSYETWGFSTLEAEELRDQRKIDKKPSVTTRIGDYLKRWRHKLALLFGAAFMTIMISLYIWRIGPGFVSTWGLLLLTTSEFLLVFSLDFYDSALNPDTHVVDVMNLEHGGSRFYFVALWLTVLSAFLLFWSVQPIIVMFGPLVWAAAIAFVIRYEDTYHVKREPRD